MDFLNSLERRLGRFAIHNLSLYFVAGQVVVMTLALFGRPDILNFIALLPAAVYEGQVWRVVSFLFDPPVDPSQLTMLKAVFLAFGWYMFWMMGSALEGYWGAFRFNLFIFTGWLFTVLVAFLFPMTFATNAFLAGTVFLAFAFLNPDFELVLFFILPVKIKWLALIAWIGYGITFVLGGWPARMAVLASVSNFLLFFAGDIISRLRTGRRRMQHQARVAAARSSEREPRHVCAVCGKNDLTHPMEDFRYGDDDRCYCSEHRPGAAKTS
jgi:membrane associated rhomboid family serine protease